jgi:hypothetical protein
VSKAASVKVGSAAAPAASGKGGATAAGGAGSGEEDALRGVQAVMSAKPADKALAEQLLKDAVTKVCRVHVAPNG